VAKLSWQALQRKFFVLGAAVASHNLSHLPSWWPEVLA